MKTIITIFSTFLLLSASIIAQTHTISYKINIEYDCEDGKSIFVDEGSVQEGEEITFPLYTIPDQFTEAQKLQKFLDLFEGTKVLIPEGTLNEDVHFEIAINPFPCDPENINLKQLFGITFIVIGSNTGAHLPLDYYHFNEGKEAVIKIPEVNLVTFLASEGLTIEKIVAWFIDNGLEPDLEGITLYWELGSGYVELYLAHFSKIVIGTNSTATSIEEEVIPTNYKLHQNYPNPFNPNTTITYSLPNDGFTSINIYNALGIKVKTLVNKNITAGTHTVEFVGRGLPSGIYFYEIESESFTDTKKMILLK